MKCQRLCCALSVMRTHEERVFIKKALFFVECKGKIFFHEYPKLILLTDGTIFDNFFHKAYMMRLFSYITNCYFRWSYLRRAAWSVIALIFFTLVATLVFQNTEVSTYPVGWERSFQLSSFNVAATNAAVAARDDFIMVVYEGISGKGRGIYASLSFNAGSSFLPTMKIADAASKTELRPSVAIARDGAVSVMWQCYVESQSTTRIFGTESRDFGATWSPPRELVLGKQMEMLPRVYYDDRNVLHLFYHGSVGTHINLFHAERKSGGDFETTGSLIRLTSNMRGAFFPSICISGGDFYIVWQGKEEDFSDELFFIKSSNYGRSWSSRERITRSRGNNEVPAAVKYGNSLYVVYQNNDEKNWAIRMIISDDGGRSWGSKPLRVSTTVANCYFPAAVLSGTDILIVWYDSRSGAGKIYSRKFSIKDNAFIPEVPVSDALYAPKSPELLAIGKRSFVFWGEKNVIMAKQTDISVEPPRVYSETNPEGSWSRLPYAIIRWRSPRDDSGIAGYAAIVNDQPGFNPTIMNLKPDVNMQRITDLSDGISYFHIRAVDNAGNYSRTVHYKLQVAVNPMPEPAIALPTHPHGKPNQSSAPEFVWKIDGMERVKGFVYGLSRDTITMPKHFTTDADIRFKGLTEGNYFFSVAAVDRSNQVGRVATYDFIVGAGRTGPDYYKKIAEAEKRFEKRYEYIRPPVSEAVVRTPYVFIRFPFDIRKPYGKESFKALIISRNIPSDRIAGYSVYVGEEKREISDLINMRDAVIDVRNLISGEYYIGVKCKYSAADGGSGGYRWTGPYLVRITIELPAERSPYVRYAELAMGRLSTRLGFMSVALFGLAVAATTIGYGRRIRFYFRLLLFKMRLACRLLFKQKKG
jgi:hypothetical protein